MSFFIINKQQQKKKKVFRQRDEREGKAQHQLELEYRRTQSAPACYVDIHAFSIHRRLFASCSTLSAPVDLTLDWGYRVLDTLARSIPQTA